MKKVVKQERKRSTARDLGITTRSTRSKAKAKAQKTDEKKPAPTIATKNPFAALPSDSVTTTEEVEIEEAIEEEEEEEEETPQSTVVIDDLELLTYDDDDDYKMNLEKGALVTMIGSITPNKDPTRRDVQKFQQMLADKLATVTCDWYDGGYSWLVEREATHKTRVDDDTYSLPPYPKRPDHSILITATDAFEFKRYDLKNKFFLTTSFWNQETIGVIEKKFPGALLGMETADNVLPARLTARKAIEFIIGTVKSTASTHNDYVKLHGELMLLKFTPSPAGSEGYLKQCSRIQKEVMDLEDTNCKIHDAHIITVADAAFINSGHTKQFVVAINKEWETTGSTTLQEFTKFYNKELRSLYESGDTGTQQQAFHTEEIKDRLTQMEQKVATNHANIGQVNDNMHEMATMASGGDGTKSTMDMSSLSGTNINVDALVAMIAEQVQAKLGTAMKTSPSGPVKTPTTTTNANTGGNPRGVPGVVKYFKDGTAYQWRCYSKYCFSKGANFRCDGANCNRFCFRKADHNAKATYADRKGGSDKNCDKWGEFRGPDDCHYKNKSDYKASG